MINDKDTMTKNILPDIFCTNSGVWYCQKLRNVVMIT